MHLPRSRLALVAVLGLLAGGPFTSQAAAAATPTLTWHVTSPAAGQDPLKPNVGQSMTFTASGGPAGTDTYLWWFGAGARPKKDPPTATGATVTHAFAAAGAQPVIVFAAKGATQLKRADATVTVNAPPTAHFGFLPGSPVAGQAVTFFSDSTDADGGVTSWQWTFDDGATASGQAVSHAFAAAGTHHVLLTVGDTNAATSTFTAAVSVASPSASPPPVNHPPSAGFSFSPAGPSTRDLVHFTASVSDPDRQPLTYTWSFGDGGSSAERAPTHRFLLSGAYPVTLFVSDDHGGSTRVTRTVAVANQPPVASFAFFPSSPKVGQAINLVSTALDPDGPIVDHSWDLDGDGSFGDAAGPTATVTFRTPGDHQVGLRVRDDDGASATSFATIAVARDAPAPPRYLLPFPIVRASGFVLRDGVRLRLLGVKAPRGARIAVACRGHRCPVRTVRRRANGRMLHVRPLERRLRAPMVLEVRVTKPGRIGKYVRFRIRGNRPPARLDRCLKPGSQRPVRCP